MFKGLVVLLVLAFVENFDYAEAFLGGGSPFVTSYCTVAPIVTIKSIKTGNYIDGGESEETLKVKPEESAQNRFWKLLAGNGFFIFENVNTSNIFDVKGGCSEGLEKADVISYQQSEIAANNRFYINPLDHTIGVGCPNGGTLKLKVVDGSVVIERITNFKSSTDDIHFNVERVS